MLRHLLEFITLAAAVLYFIFIIQFFNNNQIEAKDFITFFSVLPLAIIALFQEQIKRWWLAPILRIEFNLSPPFCSKTPFYAFLGQETVGTEAYYFRIKIINCGRTSARLCEVVMTELLVETEDKKFVEVDYFQQVNLKWDTGKTKDAFVTLNPSPIGMLCDIGYISRQYEPNLFHLEYLYTIGGYQPTVLAPRTKYRFSIGIISENAEYGVKHFEFYWSGVWGDTEQSMFREVNIKRIN